MIWPLMVDNNAMIEYVQTCVVRDEHRGQFELSFGPGGAWSRIFARSPGFYGITLLRNGDEPRRYVVIEVWEDRTQREAAIASNQREYADFLPRLERWIESRQDLGIFTRLAEAGVRPQRKPRRR